MDGIELVLQGLMSESLLNPAEQQLLTALIALSVEEDARGAA